MHNDKIDIYSNGTVGSLEGRKVMVRSYPDDKEVTMVFSITSLDEEPRAFHKYKEGVVYTGLKMSTEAAKMLHKCLEIELYGKDNRLEGE